MTSRYLVSAIYRYLSVCSWQMWDVDRNRELQLDVESDGNHWRSFEFSTNICQRLTAEVHGCVGGQFWHMSWRWGILNNSNESEPSKRWYLALVKLSNEMVQSEPQLLSRSQEDSIYGVKTSGLSFCANFWTNCLSATSQSFMETKLQPLFVA